MTEFREAIRIRPDFALGHINLGLALRHYGKLAEAIVEYREAIRLEPSDSRAHVNLGLALRTQGRLDEAIAALREAIRLKPDDVTAHSQLGLILAGQGKPDEAIAAFRAAIRIRPDSVDGHNNLGSALLMKGELVEAIAVFRAAMRLDPRDALVHGNLGSALARMGERDEAIAEFRAAIRLRPDDAITHCNLGHVLEEAGRFDEALTAYRRGHELGSRQPGWSNPSAEWVRQAGRMAALQARLPAVIRGEEKPGGAADGLAFADMAYRSKRYGASARLFAEAMQADPRLAEDMRSGNRYNAACAAALAGTGKGDEKQPLDRPDPSRWRKQAIEWLRADLASWTEQVQSGPPQSKAFVVPTLRHWKEDADLAGLRDEAAVKALPEDEQKACRALWAEVDALLSRIQQP